MKIASLFIAIGALSFHGLALSSDFQLPTPDLTHATAKQYWVTEYHVIATKTTDVGTPLLDVSGKALTKPIPNVDWCLGAIEGTYQIEQNGAVKVFNFVDHVGEPQVDCLSVLSEKKLSPDARAHIQTYEESRFALAKGPCGDGVHGYILVPYRSIAVDPDYIPYGSVVFIPQARGYTLRMPDGTMAYHDGYFFASDKGGGVKGNHFDIFCGLRTHNNCMPSVIQSDPHKTVEAYVVKNDAVKQELQTLHLLQNNSRTLHLECEASSAKRN